MKDGQQTFNLIILKKEKLMKTKAAIISVLMVTLTLIFGFNAVCEETSPSQAAKAYTNLLDQYIANCEAKMVMKSSKMDNVRRAAAIAGQRRPRNSAWVDSPMRIEPPVLDREERLDHMVRQLLDLDRLGHHRPLPCDRGAIAGEQGDLRGCDGFKALRQGCGDREPREE